MSRILVGLLLLLATTVGLALTEGRLLSQSSSGRTAVFNLGVHDGIQEGEYAVIVKQIRDNTFRDLRYVPAAKARSIKVTTESSIWILYHVYDAELLVRGQKFVVLTESHMLRGQRSPRIGKTTVVAPSGRGGDVARSAVASDKERMTKRGAEYNTIARPHQNKMKSDHDFEVIDLEEWEKARGQRYRSALYRSPNKEEFRRAYRLETFHNLVGSYLERVNHPDFSYDKFYDEQMRATGFNEFREKNVYDNEYDTYIHAESVKKTEDARIYRSILEKGESWSEDFSDEELRKMLRIVSVMQEQDRRETVVSRPMRNSLTFEYGLIMNDSQSDRDAGYRRNRLSEIGFDYEMTPFLRHGTLERFTLNAGGKRGATAFDSNGTNVDFDLYTGLLGANWYPFYAPYVQHAPLVFFGTFVRSGYGTANSPSRNVGARYSVFGFPGFRAGMRFILRNNVGLRIVGSMETLKLERSEVSGQGTELAESDSLVEGKLNVGLSYSF